MKRSGSAPRRAPPLPDPSSRERARRWGYRRLRTAGIDSFALDADLLLASVLGVDRLDLLLNPSAPLMGEQREAFAELTERRACREPMAYILGHREFFGLDLLTDRRALVPRPSTELVVERTLQHLGGGGARGATGAPLIVDVGTGCGAVALALAASASAATVVAADASLPAVELARENVARLGLGGRVHVVVADLQPPTSRPPDLLTANLPYVPTGDIDKLDAGIRSYEPLEALDGGRDGFAHCRRLIASAEVMPGGALICEIGHQHRAAVVEAVAARGAQLHVELFADLEGWDRVATITGWP